MVSPGAPGYLFFIAILTDNPYKKKADPDWLRILVYLDNLKLKIKNRGK
jgi:HKD family nuclease